MAAGLGPGRKAASFSPGIEYTDAMEKSKFTRSGVRASALLFAAIAGAGSAIPAARAQGADLITGVPANQDTSIVVQKGAPDLYLPDFKIVNGSDDIIGDPVAGYQESFASWKKSCADWKKDLRNMNPGQLLSISCGRPSTRRAEAGMMLVESTGTYRLKVRIRDPRTQR